MVIVLKQRVLFLCQWVNYIKKTKPKKLKYFPVGYMGKFYGNLVQGIDSSVNQDFYGRIASDAEIPSEDVQKYLLATSDFAKGMQDDINLYITRDRLTTRVLDKN